MQAQSIQRHRARREVTSESLRTFILYAIRLSAWVVLSLSLPQLIRAEPTPATTQSPFDDRKIIVFNAGNDWNWANGLAANLERMQADRPFVDGLVFHLGTTKGCPKFGFNREQWSETSLWFDELKSIASKSSRFHENFIIYWAHANNVGPDFFDDTLWRQIAQNAELFGRAAKTAGCRGIFFDPEYYSGGQSYSPWWHDKPKAAKSPPYVNRGQSFAIAGRGPVPFQASRSFPNRITHFFPPSPTACLRPLARRVC
jgi:hypothetical protein